MIVCPNCNHQNPDGSSHCEACFTPLPSTTSCPNCGASVQADATFCGQCGTGLKPTSGATTPGLPDLPPLPDFPEFPQPGETLVVNPGSSPSPGGTPLAPTLVNSPDPIAPPMPDPVVATPPPMPMPDPVAPPMPDPVVATPPPMPMPDPVVPPMPDPVVVTPPPMPMPDPVTPPMPDPVVAMPPPIPSPGMASTQLQLQSAKLMHLQTNQLIELPLNLSVIHIGKPNDQVPPDIDVSGFPNSEIVSRVHADIRVEGDAYFIEDVGSSNGTYINHNILARGNRHRLRAGDRISLGKGDLVTFLFQS